MRIHTASNIEQFEIGYRFGNFYEMRMVDGKFGKQMMIARTFPSSGKRLRMYVPEECLDDMCLALVALKQSAM